MRVSFVEVGEKRSSALVGRGFRKPAPDPHWSRCQIGPRGPWRFCGPVSRRPQRKPPGACLLLATWSGGRRFPGRISPTLGGAWRTPAVGSVRLGRRFASRHRAGLRHRRRGDDPVRSLGRTRGAGLEDKGLLSLRSPRRSGPSPERADPEGGGDRPPGVFGGLEVVPAGGGATNGGRGGKIAPGQRRTFRWVAGDPGPDRRNALFSSLKPNRGERIRTFDFLVPNQAL